jgi:hypothetical protein
MGSGADLKRVVEDGKLLFAYDRARDMNTAPATDYFEFATQGKRAEAAAIFEMEKERYGW